MAQNPTLTGETTFPSTAGPYPLHPAATISTERAARYGKQLVSHYNNTSRLVAPGGGAADTCCSTAKVRFWGARGIASASDQARAARSPSVPIASEFIVGIHLARFGARDNLAISWSAPTQRRYRRPPSPPRRSRRTPAPRRRHARRRRQAEQAAAQ